MRGKFTIGVDVSAAAGPVGRQASAATDSTLRAEIYSYSRSRGLFAGVALDGSALQVDPLAAATYYRYAAAAPNGNPSQPTVPLPPSAVTLMARVARYTAAPQFAALTAHATRVPPPAVVAPARATADSIRRRLANSAAQLDRLLDVRWNQYLALPAEVYGSGRHPSVKAVRSSLSRFETVLRNPAYETLSRRSEFQSTLQILRQYVNALSSGGNSTLPLPPPPGAQAFPAEFSSGPASRLPVDRGP